MPFHKLDKKGIMIYLIKSLGQVNSAKISGTASDARIPLLNVASMLSCNGTIVSMGTTLVVLDPYQTFHPQSNE